MTFGQKKTSPNNISRLKIKLGFLASGRGSNMLAILNDCKAGRLDAEPAVVISNNAGAGALEYAREVGIPAFHLSSATHEEESVLDDAITDTLRDCSPDIVEMVGLLDYFDRAEAEKLFESVYRHLKVGGWFIVSNVLPNPEQEYVREVVGWSLVYRTLDELRDLAAGAGFAKEHVQLIVEPMKVYAIAACQKQ